MGSPAVTITPDTAPNPQVTITPDTGPAPSKVDGKEGFWHSFSAFLPGYHEDDPYGAVKDLVSGLKEAATHPETSTSLLYHGIVDPMAATNAEAKARWNRPGAMNKVNAGAEWLESGIPILGPVLAKAGNQFESGDVGGGLGTMTGAALPVLAAKAPGVAATAARELVPEGLPAKWYQSALKPSTTLPTSKVANIVQTGLENKIPVSASGVEKLGNLIDDLNSKIKAQIDAGSASGATVNKFAVASRLNDPAKKFTTQVTPESDLNAVADTGNEFLRNQPNEIPVSDAQALKTGTYQQLKGRAYGELKSATVESQKALARGLKEEIAQQFPEVAQMNAQESSLIDLDGVLERAVKRIDNHQLMGIGTPLVAAGARAVTGSTAVSAVAGLMKLIFDDPMLKSKLAIALRRQGVPPAAAMSRIGAYSAALANAATSQLPADQTNGQQP